MARTEADREDLFQEIHSYPSRWELEVPRLQEIVVAGLRDDGRMAVYFGSDPCFQFDAANRLLRAFVAGLLHRTQGASLACLQRVRSPAATELIRIDLAGGELQTLLQTIQRRFADLHTDLIGGEYCLLRSEAPAVSFSGLLSRIENLGREGIRLAPAYPTRRH